jgi:hypothetical protein
MELSIMLKSSFATVASIAILSLAFSNGVSRADNFVLKGQGAVNANRYDPRNQGSNWAMQRSAVTSGAIVSRPVIRSQPLFVGQGSANASPYITPTAPPVMATPVSVPSGGCCH